MDKEIFWILGFGKFGSMAIKKLKSENFIEKDLVIVDSNPNVSDKNNLKIKSCDAIDWLCLAMDQHKRADWIIPALPVHVAGEFLRRKLMMNCIIKSSSIPHGLINKLPNGFVSKQGQICTSYANWVCPDNCSESGNNCTITRNPRPIGMFKLIEKLDIKGVESIVIESRQLLPGLGGYRPKYLDLALNKLNTCVGSTFMVATACKCHGIIDFMTLS